MSFFERFPDFQADPTAVLADEFARLALHSGWKKKSEVYKEQRAECLVTEFHYHFDTTDKLESWQVMCLKVGIEAGESITKCKKALKTQVHVNIYDMIDHERTGVALRKFSSYNQLRLWTKNHKKYFPLEEAKTDKVLAVLLKTFF